MANDPGALIRAAQGFFLSFFFCLGSCVRQIEPYCVICLLGSHVRKVFFFFVIKQRFFLPPQLLSSDP